MGTYRAPAFVFDNVCRDSGGFITEARNETTAGGSPGDNSVAAAANASLKLLTDDFNGRIYSAMNNLTYHGGYITLAFTNTSKTLFDTCIIPAGHNLTSPSATDYIRLWVRAPNFRARSTITTPATSPIVLSPLLDYRQDTFTTLTANAAQGATSVQVDSIAGLANGESVILVLNDGNNHITTINGAPSGSTVALTDALPSASDSGSMFSEYRSDNLIQVQIQDSNPNPSQLTPAMGEIICGNKVTLDRGPDPGWTYSQITQVERYTTKAGVTSQWLLGRPRKTWQLTWHNLEAADRAKIDQLYTKARGGSHPFWFLPPDTDHDWTPVELVEDAEVSSDSSAPMAIQTSRVTLKMIEVMG